MIPLIRLFVVACLLFASSPAAARRHSKNVKRVHIQLERQSIGLGDIDYSDEHHDNSPWVPRSNRLGLQTRDLDEVDSLPQPIQTSLASPSPIHYSHSSSSSPSPTHYSRSSSSSTVTLPPGLNRTVVALHDYYSVMYTGRVRIGNPPQAFRLIFDTGSADMWVSSAKKLGVQQTFLRYYNSASSDTHRRHGSPWQIMYGIGQVSGFLSSDDVQLGNLVAKGQVFAEATTVTSNFEQRIEPMDGILGFAFKGSSSSRSNTLLDTLYEQGQISSRVFSFYLGSSTVPGEKDSLLVIGPPDPSLYRDEDEEEDEDEAEDQVEEHEEGRRQQQQTKKQQRQKGKDKAIYWSDVLYSGQPQMWYVRMEAILIDGVDTGLCGFWDTPCVALPDTGTSFIAIPLNRWDALVTKIIEARSDCTMSTSKRLLCARPGAYERLPSISFRLAGRDFALQPRHYMLPNGMLAFMPSGSSFSSSVDLIILGDVFLRAYYTVFDADNLRVGFALAKEAPARTSHTFLLLFAILVLFFGLMALDCLGTFIRRQRASSMGYIPI